MSQAKVISLFGGVVYLLIFSVSLLLPGKIRGLIANGSPINVTTAIALMLAGAFLLSVVNFCYFYYLVRTQKEGEKVHSAVFYSLQLLILPLMIISGFLVLLIL